MNKVFSPSVAIVVIGTLVGVLSGYIFKSMIIGLTLGTVIGIRTGRITSWRKGALFGAIIGLIIGASVSPLLALAGSRSLSAFFTTGFSGGVYGALVGGLTWQAFKLTLGIYIFLYRLTNGKVGGWRLGLDVLLLTTTGRKTGKPHTTPLGYFEFEGSYVVSASNSGAETHPDWYYNLSTQPQVHIQINNQQLEATAEIAAQEQRERLWARLTKLAPAYALYAIKARRQIPLVIFHATNGLRD